MAHNTAAVLLFFVTVSIASIRQGTAEFAFQHGDSVLYGQCPIQEEFMQHLSDRSQQDAGRDAKHAEKTKDGSTSWIVRFKKYKVAHDHHQELRHTVPGEGAAWRWIDRANKAALHPTDFGIVSIQPATHAAVASRIQGMASVRDMHPDRRFTGHLNWVPEGPLRQAVFDLRSLKAWGNSVEHEGDMQDPAGEGRPTDFSVQKRPGRMTTQFPIISDENLDDAPAREAQRGRDRQLLGSEGAGADGTHTEAHGGDGMQGSLHGKVRAEAAGGARNGNGGRRAGAANTGRSAAGADSLVQGQAHVHAGRGGRPLNLTLDTARRRLLGRSTITSMLEADKIWKQGFSGKGVKVGEE